MFSRFQMSERGKGKCLKNCDDNSGPLPRFIQAKKSSHDCTDTEYNDHVPLETIVEIKKKC